MSSPNRIRAIFYDLDGTLRTNVPSGRVVLADQAAALGLSIPPETHRRAALWEHRYFAESPEIIRDRAEFQDESRAFWLNYCFRQLQVMGASQEQARELAPQITAHMREHFKPKDTLFEQIPETLRALRASGYFLGIMSNRFEPYTEYLKELGLSELFDLVVYAGEIGVRKPNPEIFQYMLQKSGFAPAQSVYIGDNYFADIIGAQNAGMLGILYDHEGLFENPDCPVIRKHTQILELLGGNNE